MAAIEPSPESAASALNQDEVKQIEPSFLIYLKKCWKQSLAYGIIIAISVSLIIYSSFLISMGSQSVKGIIVLLTFTIVLMLAISLWFNSYCAYFSLYCYMPETSSTNTSDPIPRNIQAQIAELESFPLASSSAQPRSSVDSRADATSQDISSRSQEIGNVEMAMTSGSESVFSDDTQPGTSAMASTSACFVNPQSSVETATDSSDYARPGGSAVVSTSACVANLHDSVETPTESSDNNPLSSVKNDAQPGASAVASTSACIANPQASVETATNSPGNDPLASVESKSTQKKPSVKKLKKKGLTPSLSAIRLSKLLLAA